MSDAYAKSVELYSDEIGRVDYVDHMGDDLTVVNSCLLYTSDAADES